ncbi:MAG: PhoPQ-activated pathogenicity-related family protein [Bryobacterales bacterium]|nr:PhoPQ-activated pathogenicity-related family protein [Bryobacterales bacterium]
MKRSLFAAVIAVACLSGAETVLDRYIKKPDSTYQWKVVGDVPCGGCKATVIDMTSQTWRTAQEVDRPVWKHWVTVIRPQTVKYKTALLFIAGGNIRGRAPERADPMLVNFARETGAVMIELRMIPNEPLQFAGETKTRTEDAIIAYTWDKFLRGGDDEWPARLPMTKAAVRAMDTVTAFLQQPEGGGLTVNSYIVAGASKRGWTTWTTAAVDKRVVAIAPLVIDLLNMEKSFIHHWRAYGFWAPAVKDYVDMGIMDWIGSPENKKLMKAVEPYEYRDRLTMPKYIVNASGDQFFLPDSSQFYFKDLKGEKLLRYVPNASHSLQNSDAPLALLAWMQEILENKPRPRYSWRIDNAGTIRVKAVDTPREVKLWQATNANARDFRLDVIGPAYKSTVLQPEKNGEYIARVAAPEKGFSAYFVELTYPGLGKFPIKVTTDVRVTPNRYPFAAPKLKKPVVDKKGKSQP